MNPKFFAGLLAVALAGYFFLMTRQAVALISTGNPVLIGLGGAILVLPVIGAWVVVQEWRFGIRVHALADHLAERGELPLDDLPKRLSGRPQRDAADERFTQRALEVESAPNDPGAWFRLAVAYDDSGDRKRGRAAMRRAVAAHRAIPPEPSAGAQWSDSARGPSPR